MSYRMSIGMCLVILAATLAVRADGENDPKKQLEEQKKLTLQGVQFVLTYEMALNKDIAEVNKAKATLTRAERDYRSSETKINKAKAYIASLQYNLDKLKTQNEGKVVSQTVYNQIVEKVNTLTKEITDLTKEKQEREEKAQQEVDDARAKYAQLVIETAIKADKINERYEQFKKDEAVMGLIKQAGEKDENPYTLGPSRAFESRYRLLTKMREEIDAGEVSVRREGNIMWVDVKMNGKASRSMVLDTGAAAISLPYDVAVELEIEPTDADPVVQVQLADGKLVDARLKTLDSVQVGQFLQNNVECLVLPKELVAAHPLLGGTFLNHYIYRIDPERQSLLLTRSEKNVKSLLETMPTPKKQPQPQPDPDKK